MDNLAVNPHTATAKDGLGTATADTVEGTADKFKKRGGFLDMEGSEAEG